MTIETLAYWGAFAIPIVLLAVGVIADKVISDEPFKREHFFMGMDLTIYFLASVLINALDFADKQPFDAMSLVWTLVLLLAAIVMLVTQIGIHQAWREKKGTRSQFWALCIFANALGILLLYGFVKLKTRGLL